MILCAEFSSIKDNGCFVVASHVTAKLGVLVYAMAGVNWGVGFVNFILPHHAQRFQKDMEGKYFDEEHMQNGLAIQIERADVQGLKANRARFTKESDFGPWLSKTKQVVPLLEIGIWAGIPRRRKEGQTEPLVEI